MAADRLVKIGSVLDGRYRLMSLLGQGGGGAVYLAEDMELFNRPVAVKEMVDQFTSQAERDAAVARFAQEAKMLVTLSHPNLPDLRSYFTEGGRQYLVMEYIEGTTLLAQLEQAKGALAPSLVAEWGRQICDVLSYLHGRTPPVVFRDLKPSNIMLDRHGRIKLIDFGTARNFDLSKNTDTLKMGSIGYAAPEQYQGQGQTSPRSDIYALGVTLHQLLTNADPTARPFVFTPPSLLRLQVHESLSRAVMRAVNLDPAQRFQSALEFRHALEPGVADSTTTLLQCDSRVRAQPMDRGRARRRRGSVARGRGPAARASQPRQRHRQRRLGGRLRIACRGRARSGHRRRYCTRLAATASFCHAGGVRRRSRVLCRRRHGSRRRGWSWRPQALLASPPGRPGLARRCRGRRAGAWLPRR